MLDPRVGEAVKASSKADIKKAIGKIFTHRDTYFAAEVVDFGQYRWNTIAARYIDIYARAKSE